MMEELLIGCGYIKEGLCGYSLEAHQKHFEEKIKPDYIKWLCSLDNK